ncbi:MAG: ATP-binding protein [Thermoguttaceae bacterium]|nr:ATP-binding protein [Thermoguttaceae bacterium]MBR0190942.1 ATP-binding protein [Thermoguttaceae bacterium]
MWFEGQFQLLCGDTADTLYISAEAPFVLDWYRRNFQKLFREAVRALFPTFTGTIQYCTREEADAMNSAELARENPVLPAIQTFPQAKSGAVTQIHAVKTVTKPEKEAVQEPAKTPATRSELLAERRRKSREAILVAEQANIPGMVEFLRGEAPGLEVKFAPKSETEPVQKSAPAETKDPMADFVSLMDQMAAEGKIRKSLLNPAISVPEPVVEAVLPEPVKAKTSTKTRAKAKTETPKSATKKDLAGTKLQALMANVMALSEAEEAGAPKEESSLVPRHSAPRAFVPVEERERRTVGYSTGTFDSFVCGSSNRVAYTTARSLNRNLGLVSPILFTGPTGVGKTHLLDAIYREALNYGFSVAYKTCEEFMNDFVASLRDPRRKSEFQETYRQCDVLLLDNLQFMLDKKGTIPELHNIFNYRMRHGKQIVLASDRELKELEGLGLELCSLLRGGCECRLNEPSFDVRLEILSRGSKLRNLPLTAEQQHKIAVLCTGDVRELLGKLNTLEMMVRAQFSQPGRVAQEEISAQERTSVVQQIVDGLVDQPGRTVSLDEIKRYVAVQFGIDVQLLSSGKRTRNVSQPRMLAMWLARKFTRKPLSEISQSFGCSSHSTVISAQKKVESWRTTDFRVQTVESVQSVNDLLFQLESQIQRAL